ncbi:MAG TPA: PEP-CTERM sorting domain-containing protein, partial [Verrucomicrobiales bacterium]|nr:PEP-CTERM sorting domain-containing protein [Verrucomicrobiales bacterium]
MDHPNPTHHRPKAVIQRTRLAAYAAAGTAATFSGTQNADGAITYTQVGFLVQDTAIGGSFASKDLLFDTFHLTLLHSLGASNAATGYAIIDPDLTSSPAALFAGFANGNFDYVTKVPAGSAISSLAFPALDFATMAYNGGYGGDQFLDAGMGFIGVQFDGDRFGWVRVNMSGSPLNAFTIVDYAYGGHGEAINAGQVPEPSSLGLLAMGATGLAAWRR